MKKSAIILLASLALSALASCKVTSTSDALVLSAIDGLSLPTYTLKDGVYTFPLSGSSKEGVKLSGGLKEGSIVIDPGSLSDNKSFEIDLSNVSISSSSAYPIYYGSKASKLIVKAVDGTTNSLTYSGNEDKGAALYSENNLEIEGNGSLSLATTKAGHGARGDDLVLLDAPSLSLSAIHDGFHGKTFTASSFSGSAAIANSGSEAFDICDNDETGTVCKGAITFGASTGQFTIGQCVDVFEADNSFSIPSGVSIVAEKCSSDPVTNLNANAINVAVEGTFKVNGAALTSYSVATKAS